MPTIQSELYLANSFELFDESGKFNNQGTIDFLQSFVNTFVDLINKYKG